MARILIVEDEKAIAELLEMNLRAVGHTCETAGTGKEAVRLSRITPFDLMLLDVMLPDMDGFQVLERIREIPTIFLTAVGTTTDKVRGLGLGADDYIVKPFEMAELLARIQSVLRRTHKAEERYTLGDLSIDWEAHSVTLRGEPVELTHQEFTLLHTLIENRNVCLTREKLLNMAWGIRYMGESRTVDVHIQRLRRKLDLDDHIRTIYKNGYRFEE